MSTTFRQRLLTGEKLFGTMLTIPSIPVAEILTNSDFDWLFIDAEHGALSNPSLLQILTAIGPKTPSLIRTSGPDEVAIKQALDLGATGIIAPQVNSAAQAAQVVKFARYSPQGARGVGLGRAQLYGLNFQNYLEKAQNETVVVVQAEHRLAVESIEETVQVPGIDAILIGPYDLSASYGLMGQLDHPKVTEAIDHVTRVCLQANIPLGIFGITPDAVAPYAAKGFSLIVAGVDTLLLGTSAKELSQKLKTIGS